MRRGRDPDLVDLAGASVLEVAWTACRYCGRRCEPGHSVTAPTAAGLHQRAYHPDGRLAWSSVHRRETATGGTVLTFSPRAI